MQLIMEINERIEEVLNLLKTTEINIIQSTYYRDLIAIYIELVNIEDYLKESE